MIELTRGNILQADAEALVNTVNCVGVMGRGIALQFKKEFPENFSVYKAACDRKELKPGRMLVVNMNRLENPRYVINFPTKRHWRGKSRMEDVQAGLEALVEEIRTRNIQSVAIPPLGCGLGGLDWSEVRPLIEQAFEALPDVRVLLYEPAGTPAADEMPKSGELPRMTEGRAALLGLMQRYLSAVMDPYCSLLEIHKLLYFMQEAGEPLKLRFSKGPYGPYAENLRHVLNAIEGHFISGFGDAEDDPGRRIELVRAAAQLAEEFLESHPETRARFGRVADLIAGYETPYGMELLSTVHWIACHDGATSVKQAIERVRQWSNRKKKIPEDHIRLAWTLLTDKRMIPS